MWLQRLGQCPEGCGQHNLVYCLHARLSVCLYTLNKISNWSPSILYACFESKIQIYKVHALINQPRCCRDSCRESFKMTDTSCKDDARVKVNSFQKSHFSKTLKIPQRRYPFVFLFV